MLLKSQQVEGCHPIIRHPFVTSYNSRLRGFLKHQQEVQHACFCCNKQQTSDKRQAKQATSIQAPSNKRRNIKNHTNQTSDETIDKFCSPIITSTKLVHGKTEIRYELSTA
jgi:hypothetical protein